MPPFARGDILLTQFPFTDLSGGRVRPCLIFSPGLLGQDLILAGISSIVRADLLPTDVLVERTHPEFAGTKLRVSSVIRLHKLVTVEQSIIIRRLGTIGSQLQAEVNQRLRIALGL